MSKQMIFTRRIIHYMCPTGNTVFYENQFGYFMETEIDGWKIVQMPPDLFLETILNISRVYDQYTNPDGEIAEEKQTLKPLY